MSVKTLVASGAMSLQKGLADGSVNANIKVVFSFEEVFEGEIILRIRFCI